MVIKELKMKNFGKFTYKDIELRDGINIVYGNNESGKSTVHSFIRGMLFGLEKKRGRASKDNLYERYKPWEGNTLFSGYMKVEDNGEVYDLSRVFTQEEKKIECVKESNGEDCVIDDTIAAPENEFSVLDTPPSLQHTPTESTKDSFSIPYPISRSTHLSHTPRVSNSINLPTSTPSSITNLTLSSQAYSNFHSSSSPLSRTSITRPMSPQRRYSSDHKKNSFQILRHSNSVNLSDQEHPPSESQHSVLSSSPSPLGGVPHPVNINLDILQTPETFTAFPPYSLFTTPSNEQS